MKDKQQIGLALSGGGVRAAVFHLGLLARLAEDHLLESTKCISTVSGGSLAVGLIYTNAGNKWPSSNQYLDQTLAAIRRRLLTSSVQWSYGWRSILLPWRLVHGRAHVLASVIKKQWGIDADIQSLSDRPQWLINATCFETGKNWRFSKQRMGDYKTNFVLAPQFPIAEAISASAAVPGLIGPLTLHTKNHSWKRFISWDSENMEDVEQGFKKFHLWDGGVYDNLGVEPLYKPSGGLQKGIEFLIVSDASMPLLTKKRFKKRFIRLTDIATDQVRSIRARTMYEYFQTQPGTGAYVRMGYSVPDIYSQAHKQAPTQECLDFLSDNDVRSVNTFPTTLRRIKPKEFDLIFRHGYEATDATLSAYLPDKFTLKTCNIRW